MVIPFKGAIDAFLSIFNLLPYPIQAFIVMSLLIIIGACILKMVSNL